MFKINQKTPKYNIDGFTKNSDLCIRNFNRLNYMNYRRLFLLIIMVLSINIFYVSGQEMALSIEQMFELCDQNSRNLKLSATEVEKAQQATRVAQSTLSPTIGVNLSANYLGGASIPKDFSGYDYQVIADNMNPYQFNFALEASQVLYAGGALSSQIKLAKLDAQIAELAHSDNRQAMRLLLVGNYIELYKLNNYKRVYEKNIELTNRLLADIRSKQVEGLALKNDITRYELQLQSIELGLIQVENAIKIINDQMVITLGLPRGTNIVVASNLLEELPLLASEADWQASAEERNIAIKKAELGSQQAEEAEQLAGSDMKPTIAAFAATRLDGTIIDALPDMNMVNSNFHYWYAGVGVKYNLSSLYKTNRKVKEARFATAQAREAAELVREEIEIAVNAAYTKFVESFDIYNTQKKSVVLATENYDVVNKRYMNDLVLITDMLDATTEKLNAELQLENAHATILFNYFKLCHLTNQL